MLHSLLVYVYVCIFYSIQLLYQFPLLSILKIALCNIFLAISCFIGWQVLMSLYFCTTAIILNNIQQKFHKTSNACIIWVYCSYTILFATKKTPLLIFSVFGCQSILLKRKISCHFSQLFSKGKLAVIFLKFSRFFLSLLVSFSQHSLASLTIDKKIKTKTNKK